MYASSPAIRDASKKQVPKHKEYTAVLDWIESMLYKEQPEDPLGFLRDLLANPPQVSALSVAKPIEVPQPAVSTELPSSGENGPILEMAAEMYTRLIEDNRALWEKNQTKQKEVQNEMESLVTQLNKNNAQLAEENQALKQQLEEVLAEQASNGGAPGEVLGGDRLAAENERLAEDNKQLYDQFQSYHSRVRSDMNELITELDGYKLRLLEENSRLKAKLTAAGSPPGSRVGSRPQSG